MFSAYHLEHYKYLSVWKDEYQQLTCALFVLLCYYIYIIYVIRYNIYYVMYM